MLLHCCSKQLPASAFTGALPSQRLAQVPAAAVPAQVQKDMLFETTGWSAAACSHERLGDLPLSVTAVSYPPRANVRPPPLLL